MLPSPGSAPSGSGLLEPGRLVVATPALGDPIFRRTVVLLLQHSDDDGALGVVLTRPSRTPIEAVVPGWEDLAAGPAVVFTGGPVQPDAGICLGRVAPGSTGGPGFAPLADPQLGTVDLESEPDAGLRAVRLYAGYAGWSGGQLESEVDEGSWWVLDALPGDPFGPSPEGLWSDVLRRQGLPLAFMAAATGDPRQN